MPGMPKIAPQKARDSSTITVFEHELKYNADSDLAYVNLANFYRNRDQRGDLERAEWYARQEIFESVLDWLMHLNSSLKYQIRKLPGHATASTRFLK